MQPIICHFDRWFRIGRLAGAAAILAALCLGGCHGLKSDPSRYQFDPAIEWGAKTRPNARKTDFWGFSNEARQIEKNVGVQ